MKISISKLTITFALTLCSILTLEAQNIYTFAGNGTQGNSGDYGASTSAQLYSPLGIALTATGDLYIADYNNHRVRKVNTNLIIKTSAGSGNIGSGGDGGPDSLAKFMTPAGLVFDGVGNLYISDNGAHQVRKVNTSGIISTLVSTASIAGFGGDGGPASQAKLNYPRGLIVDASGNLYIADYGNHRVRKVTPGGIISTFAGTGVFGFSGDGGVATSAQLFSPSDLAIDASGNIYICDSDNHRIRKVNTSGIISTVAGVGPPYYSGDNGPAINARFSSPQGICLDPIGNLYITDSGNSVVRKVNTSGIITTIVGSKGAGFSGDGESAINAKLDFPCSIAIDATGNLFISDAGNNRIREVCLGGCPVGLKYFSENIHKVLVFPNPNNGSFNIQIDKQINNGQLILINSVGQKVYEQKIIQGTNEIKTNDLLFGLYNYILLLDNKKIKNGKLVIE